MSPDLKSNGSAQPKMPASNSEASTHQLTPDRGLEAMQVPCGFRTGAPTFHARKAFRSAMVDGHTAQEYEPEGKAALEAARMWEWVQATLKLKSKKPRKK